MEFNAVLDRESRPENLHEGFLERKLEELDGLDVGRGMPYWLTVARITELAFLCAGTYADSGELAAAGDLLVNPRLILIHVRGVSEPFVKKRRVSLADQLSHLVPTAEGVARWLKANTWVEVRQEPLLPHLCQRLEQSGFLARRYLESVDRRMKRIADVISFVAGWHLPEGGAVSGGLRHLPRQEWEFVEENLCRFDRTLFVCLGEELRGLDRGCARGDRLNGTFEAHLGRWVGSSGACGAES